MNALDIANKLDPETKTCRAIVETPAGHRSKFDYDPETGLFELAGVLPAGMAFPLAFGFIPGTLGEDGDPVDILVIADEDLPIGCLVTVKLLGIIEAEQTEEGLTCRNDRVIGRIVQSRMHADVDDLEALGEATVDVVTRFFVAMNALKGKSFEVKAIGDAVRACALIREGARNGIRPDPHRNPRPERESTNGCAPLVRAAKPSIVGGRGGVDRCHCPAACDAHPKDKPRGPRCDPVRRGNVRRPTMQKQAQYVAVLREHLVPHRTQIPREGVSRLAKGCDFLGHHRASWRSAPKGSRIAASIV